MQTLNREKNWDFDAGLLPLDFANTADWHARSNPVERLNSYGDLVGWAWKAGLLPEERAQLLLGSAAKRPQDANQALAKAIDLRETIYRILSDRAAGKEIPIEALEYFNTTLAESLSQVKIEIARDGFIWGWSDEEQELDSMLWPILHATAELLTSDDLDRVGECADDRGCGYLFFDVSRNRSRRWCSMDSCGNRAKVQRHYKRKRARS